MLVLQTSDKIRCSLRAIYGIATLTMTEHEKNPEEMPLYVCGFKNVQSGTKLNVYDGKACGWCVAVQYTAI